MNNNNNNNTSATFNSVKTLHLVYTTQKTLLSTHPSKLFIDPPLSVNFDDPPQSKTSVVTKVISTSPILCVPSAGLQTCPRKMKCKSLTQKYTSSAPVTVTVYNTVKHRRCLSTVITTGNAATTALHNSSYNF